MQDVLTGRHTSCAEDVDVRQTEFTTHLGGVEVQQQVSVAEKITE